MMLGFGKDEVSKGPHMFPFLSFCFFVRNCLFHFVEGVSKQLMLIWSTTIWHVIYLGKDILTLLH